MADIQLIQGKTFIDVLRWEIQPIVYKPITGASKSAPLRLDVVSHGLVNGWRAAITNMKGMIEANADANSIRDKDYHPATVIDANTVDINDINAAGFKPYISGGILQYNPPKDLSNMSARMAIKERLNEKNLLRCSAITTGITGSTKPEVPGVDGGVTWVSTTNVATKEWVAGATYSVNDVIDTKTLLFLTIGNGRIAVDNALKTITRTLPAALLALQTWKTAYYDFEGFTSDAEPVVTLLASGKITLGNEVTK